MKRQIVLLLCFAFALSFYAQDMKMLFQAMPMDMLPYLDKNKKLDLIDFKEAGMAARVTNVLDGMTELTELTKDYLFLKTTKSSTMEAKLLPLKDTINIICLITTVYSPVADSRVDFYSTDWKKLSDDIFLKKVELKNFLKPLKGEVKQIEKIYRDILFVYYSLSDTTTQLTATLKTGEYLGQNNDLQPCVQDSAIQLRWKKKFIPIKK